MILASTSRYAGLPQLTYVAPDGKTIVYFSRRIVPQPATIDSPTSIVVQQSDRDRLDLITTRALHQQPELFWRIADANAAMNPFDLTHPPGTVLQVPAPQV